MKLSKSIIIFDGSNFYHKLKDAGFPHPSRFDYQAFSKHLTSKSKLVSKYYCIGKIRAKQEDKKARLLVLSSISEKSHFEGFGLVYLEANASGLPVIGSLESGAEDAIRDGRTGFLVSQNDSEGIAEAIIKILGNKNLAETMSSEAIKWASEHDMDKVIMKYKGIYASSVINKPNK